MREAGSLPLGRGQAGFTLIEMIVVLVVLGLMLGLIVTRGPMHSTRVEIDAATRDLVGALRLARAQAIAQNRPVALLIDPASRAYWSVGSAPRSLPGSVEIAVQTPLEDSDGHRRASVAFAPDGSSSGGAITLAEGTHRVRVGVDWLTGRISIAAAR
jgi:general secretion pathway protein H